MEKVDVYNCRHEKLGYSKPRNEVEDGEYRLSCFVWILDTNNRLLIQQRMPDAKKFPNMWETTSGGADENETSLEGIIREIKEEINLDVDKEELMFLGSHIRIRDFVEVYLLKKDVDIDKLDYKNVENVEVQDLKWVTIEEFEKMINNKEALDTGYYLFKTYYDNVIKRGM